MKTLIVAAAILGFTSASAFAECSTQHMAKAKTDKMTTASVTTDQQAAAPAEAAPQDEVILPKEE